MADTPAPAPAPAAAPAAAPASPVQTPPPAQRFNAAEPPKPANNEPITDDPFDKFDTSKPKDTPKETLKDIPKDTPKDVPKDSPKDDKAPDDKKPDDKPQDKPEDKGGKKTGWQRFREEERKLSDFKKTVAQEKAALEARVKELSAKAGGEFDFKAHPEVKKIIDAETAHKARVAELEDKMRFFDYEQSAEYKEKYYNPYVEKWQDAITSISELMIPSGEEGKTRPATKADFMEIVGAKSSEEAMALAEKIFGSPTKAAMAMEQRRQIMAAHRTMEKAKDDFKTRGAELRKQQTEQMQQQAELRSKLFEKFSNDEIEKHPNWFKPADGDDEGNNVLKRGYMLADAAFGGKYVDDNGQERPLTPEETVKLDAMIRNKAGGFDRLTLQNERLEKKIKELEDELADYRETEPGGGEKGREKPADNDLELPALLRGG